MMIKTMAILFKGNWQAFAKPEVVTENFPSVVILFFKKVKRNTIIHLPKSVKKLDGEETGSILLNGHKVITSNRMPNKSEVNVHTCFLEKVRIEGPSMTKASVLDHGVGLMLVVISQVEVWCIIFIYLHVLGLRFCSLLLELFFLFVLLIIQSVLV